MAATLAVFGLVAAGMSCGTTSQEAEPPQVAVRADVQATDAEREAGAALYAGRACASCHHPVKDQSAMGLGPSIQLIKAGYATSEAGGINGIARFLNGEGPAIINPELYPIMQGQLAITKTMTAAQRRALAAYIMK